MKPTTHLVAMLLAVVISSPASAAEGPTTPGSLPPIHVNHPALKKLNWQLAAQASTFADMTTFDMIDLLHSLDFHHIELAPGQVLSNDRKDAKINQDMAAADVDALLAKLKSVKMDIVSYGPVPATDVQTLLAFAKRLKLKTVVVEDPPADAMETLDHTVSDAGLNVAVYVHRDWGSNSSLNVEEVLKLVDGRSPRVGLCVDVASWRRVPIVPPRSAAESIKRFGSRVIEVHLSDVGEPTMEAPIGAGNADVSAVVRQLKEQGFKGICSVKYNSGSGDARTADFIKSVNAFSEMLDAK
jgi:sugar phosphate isomerase/epimerase